MNKSILRALAFCLAVIPAFSSHADRLKEMISPINNPTNFEDPRIDTEIRPIYAYHELDDKFVTAGGNVRLYAVQARFAINDRWGIIATKDGWIDFNPNSVLNDDTGLADIAAGVKYAFAKADDFIASAALRYEAATGDEDVLQGQGDGFIQPSVSAAWAFDNMNVMASTGLRLRMDDSDSSFWDADLHFDYNMNGFYPTVEFSMSHVMDAGSRLPIADEGQDLFSFGSTEADGKTLITCGVGARYRISEDIDWGASYQFPLTSGSGSRVIDFRVITDLIFRFNV